MRKARTIICLLVLALTVPAAYIMHQALPPDAQPMIERKYGGWSGVVRLWVREGWQDGCAAWLNRCIASFEKRHPGVYIQPEYVDAGALEAEGLPPPDLILFPPGALDGGGLANLEIDPPLLNGLPLDERAVPVMLGGYLWAWNASLLDGLPDNWREAGVSLAVPEDDADHLWSAAMLALCSSKYNEARADPTDAPRGEIELGLAGDEPSPTPSPNMGTLSCQLPEDCAPSADAWRQFINGEASATPVTAREIQRLKALSDQGKGPDWRLGGAGDGAFTDQVLYLAANEPQDPEKLELCRDFAAHLLTDECQGMLCRIGACAVTGADSGYAAGDALRHMAQLLGDRPLIVPGPFDRTWRTDAEGIVREFTENGGDPGVLLRRLAERLRQ